MEIPNDFDEEHFSKVERDVVFIKVISGLAGVSIFFLSMQNIIFESLYYSQYLISFYLMYSSISWIYILLRLAS